MTGSRLTQRQLQHLHLRAGFGLRLDWLPQGLSMTREENVAHLFAQSRMVDPLEVSKNDIPSLREIRNMTDKEKMELQKKGRQGVRALNLAWIDRMCNHPAQLRERMTLFWHNHFACRINQVHIAQSQNNLFRTHALGSFADMLKAISKDAGMLRFLNNQQNRKIKPNENFARELLELFTLGRDNGYTEDDIKEAARAFTGWTSLPNGSFFFRARQHDFGRKSFLGKRGNFNGNDILDILLEDRRTATYISTKIFTTLVHPNPNQDLLKHLSKEFYESGYQIESLLRQIVLSDHFYHESNIGSQIKSPILYLVSLMRMLNLQFQNPEILLYFQRLFGQVLLQPPTVAGWPKGQAWIDSSSLMNRLTIPKAAIFSETLSTNVKPNFAGNESGITSKQLRQLKELHATIDWNPLRNYISDKAELQAIGSMLNYFLQKDPLISSQSIADHIKNDGLDKAIRKAVTAILCTPEFQLA